MTQDAIVTRLLPNDMAEVVVTRTTACGSNCGSCESCIFQSELKAVAKNHINARPGQQVVIASRTDQVFLLQYWFTSYRFYSFWSALLQPASLAHRKVFAYL